MKVQPPGLAALVAITLVAIGASAQTFVYVPNTGSANVSAFSVNAATGALTPIANSPFPAGCAPTFMKITPSKRFAYVANGTSEPYCANGQPSSISAYSIDPATGALTPVPGSPFPAGTVALGMDVSPSGQFVYVANTVSNDISAYAVNAVTGALTPVPGSPFPVGIYPVSVTVAPSGKFAYVSHPSSNSISVHSIDGTTGALTQISSSPFPADCGPFFITVAPSGQFLYVDETCSNRVSAYSIDSTTGAITPIVGSPFPAPVGPHAVSITPTGQFAYVGSVPAQSISAYTVDATTGALTPVSGSPFGVGKSAAYFTVDASGTFGYASNFSPSNLSAYAMNAATGALTEVSGSPYSTGDWPGTPATVTFPTLAYNVCLLYDSSKAVKSGATIPIKLQLCDSNGTNLSASNVVIHATSITQVSTSIGGLVQDAGNANPDSNFRYDATLGGSGGYIFNLKTTGLSTGSYNMNFTVGSDSSSYAAKFQVK